MKGEDLSTETQRTTQEDDCRWSGIFPPHSAFTFAVVWDPDHDFMAFSEHGILHTDSKRSSHYLLPPHEHIADLDYPSASSAQSSRRSTQYHDAVEQYDDDGMFASFTLDRNQRSLRGMTQTSSTLGGLDVYLKGATMSLTHRNQPVYSILDFSSDFQFDPHLSAGGENIYQVYLSRGENPLHGSKCGLNTASRLSLGWTSIESPTQNQIVVERDARFHSRKRLKKRRPSGVAGSAGSAKLLGPLPPTEREHISTPLSALRHLFLCKELRGRLADDHDWIWVDAL